MAPLGDEQGDAPPPKPSVDESSSSQRVPRTTSNKRAKLVHHTHPTELLGVPRSINCADDLDDYEVQRCVATLNAGVRSISPKFWTTASMLEDFLAAVFNDWKSSDGQRAVESFTRIPAGKDSRNYCWDREGAFTIDDTNDDGERIKRSVAYALWTDLSVPSLTWTLKYLKDDGTLDLSKDNGDVSPTQFLQAKKSSAHDQSRREFLGLSAALRIIVRNLTNVNKDFVVRQARRLLYQRSTGASLYHLDPIRDFIAIDQIIALLPPLSKVSEDVVQSVDFFGQAKREKGV